MLTLIENQSIHILLSKVHRWLNPGSIQLKIIEVQTGSYLAMTTSCGLKRTIYEPTESHAKALNVIPEENSIFKNLSTWARSKIHTGRADSPQKVPVQN